MESAFVFECSSNFERSLEGGIELFVNFWVVSNFPYSLGISWMNHLYYWKRVDLVLFTRIVYGLLKYLFPGIIIWLWVKGEFDKFIWYWIVSSFELMVDCVNCISALYCFVLLLLFFVLFFFCVCVSFKLS